MSDRMRRRRGEIRKKNGQLNLDAIRRRAAWATPGQIDAGFASLATFLAGLFAVRELATESLAAYSLLFAAFTAITQIPTELIFIPSQILAADLPILQRLGMLAHSVPRGAFLSFLSALAVPFGALLVASRLTPYDMIGLATSAALLAAVSPIQDHVRTMLHMAEDSWIAAGVSVANFGTTALTLASVGSMAAPWAPFGALFVGNLLSMLAGLWWVHRQQVTPLPRPTLRELRWLGGWLLVTGFSKTGLQYAIRALLGSIAGIAALAHVEGARIVAQPINVMATGLMAQVGPNITRAGATRDRDLARRWVKRFVGILAIGAVPYVILTAGPWPLNPLARLAPRAYVVPGLTAATLAVVVLSSLQRPFRLQLLGARQQRDVARTTIVTGMLELIIIGTAIVLGSYAAPLATGASGLVAILWFNWRMHRLYEDPHPLSKDPDRSTVAGD